MDFDGAASLPPPSSWSILLDVIRPVLFSSASVLGIVKLIQVLTRSILLPSSILGRNLPHLDQCKSHFQVGTGVTIPNGPTRTLDARIVGSTNTKHGWLVYSNANGVCYEHVLDYTHRLGLVLNKRVCVYNYRGVGRSTGTATNAQDLTQDLLSVMRYLDSNQIVLWGHSIGGAVSVLAAAETVRMKENANLVVISDRSFGSLSHVVLEKLTEGALGAVLGGFLMSVLTATVAVLLRVAFQVELFDTEVDPLLRALVAGVLGAYVSLRLIGQQHSARAFGVSMAVQYVLGDWILSRYQLDSLLVCVGAVFITVFELVLRNAKLNQVLVKLVEWQGWHMDPQTSLDQTLKPSGIPVVCTFHAQDEMISMPNSLQLTGKRCVELRPNHLVQGQFHMYPLSDTEMKQVMHKFNEQ
jgi:pimeloyl-ACP methyl ester carboxylesterase